MVENSDIITNHILAFTYGSLLIGILSALANFIFITCLNIAAENQVIKNGKLFEAFLFILFFFSLDIPLERGCVQSNLNERHKLAR